VIAAGTSHAQVVGSGMVSPLGEDASTEVLAASSLGIPSVIDAGALDFAENFSSCSVLTPHHGELQRLCDRLGITQGNNDRESATNVARALSMAVLVKGAEGAVVNHRGELWELPQSTPWLATAGTGDALAGIIGAVLASWHERLQHNPDLVAPAAAAGALIHQIAAARASARAVMDADSPSGGPFSVTDLCREIPGVVGETLSQRA
jgi:ADP-dependent NAD(P)H-hydrate dehydratase / NAD(P)H-hydrate epimerase